MFGKSKYDRRIQALQSAVDEGRLDEYQMALGFKKFYDWRATSFDARDLKYMESIMIKHGLPLTEGRQGKSDGLLAQTASGFLEGFTTFGFADQPDTSTEKLANSLSHLLGLAPGIVFQGLRGAKAAVGVVGRGVQRQAKARGIKGLDNVGQKLIDKSDALSITQHALAKKIDKIARSTAFGKVSLKGRPIGVDPETGKKLYGLQSFPGQIAMHVQKQGVKWLHDNNIFLVKRLHQGLLKNRFISKEVLDNMVEQSVHLGLLLAASAQPLGTRGEGWKGMATAGFHGTIAGAVFAGIGNYANIGRMLGSKNEVVRTSGERIVRSFAKALKEQPNRLDQYETINFLMRGSAGATYGTITANLNDLPMEEQLYETLMAVFFSVNSRAAFENRATRDIYNRQNAMPRDLKMKEARKWLHEQPFYQNESRPYQAYWNRYLKDIQRQQMDYVIPQFDDITVMFAEVYKDLKDKGIITPEMEKSAETDIKAREEILTEMYNVLEKQGIEQVNDTDKSYSELFSEKDKSDIKVDVSKKEFQFYSIDLDETRTLEYAIEDVDPMSEHLPKQKSLKDIFIRIKKYNPQASVQDVHNLFRKTLDDNNYDVDKFVNDISSKFRIKISEEEKRSLIQSAHTLKHIDRFPITRIYLVGTYGKDGVKEADMDPIIEAESPELDPYGKPIGGRKSGTPEYGPSRLNKIYGRPDETVHYDIDYLTTRILQRYWDYEKNKYRHRMRVGNIAPMTVDIFKFIKPQELIDPDTGKFKKGKRVATPVDQARYLNKKHLKSLQKSLNKEGAYIHAVNGETGRLQIRAYPWSTKKGTRNYLSITDLKEINDALIKKGVPVTKGKFKSNVATLVWRLKEMNIWIGDREVTSIGISYEKGIKTFRIPKSVDNSSRDYKKDIIRLIPEWIKLEPYDDVTKFQKRTKHMTGIEIPLDPEYFKHIKKGTEIAKISLKEKQYQETRLPLDVGILQAFLNTQKIPFRSLSAKKVSKGYVVDYTDVFDKTYIIIEGKRAFKENQEEFDQFKKDNPELTKRIDKHNQKVLEFIGPDYKSTGAYEDLTATQAKKLPANYTGTPRSKKSWESEDVKHIYIEDLPSSVTDMGELMKKFNSGTDGATMETKAWFDTVVKNYGYDIATGVLKTLGVFRPEDYWSEYSRDRGTVINKTASFRMDEVWDAFATEIGVDKIHYRSGIKEITGVEPTKWRMVETKDGPKIELIGKANIFTSKIEDNYLNMNVYENFKKLENQKMLQQILTNANTIEMDPNTEIGRKFWDAWQRLILESASGVPAFESRANDAYSKNEAIVGSIDKISIRLIDEILYSKPASVTAQSIIKQIFEQSRQSDFERQALQEWNDYRIEVYNRQLVEDYLIDTDFDPGTYLRPGVREYVQGRVRQYVSKRLTRPVVRDSFSAKLGLYDALISQRKQRYSKADKGLANDEFMLNEGAGDKIWITIRPGTKDAERMLIKDYWKVWTKMVKNPTSRKYKKDFEAYDEARHHIGFVRSPMITNGGFRIGSFVGFAKGRSGISIITNEYNDFMMSGADKDIDSAHVFIGLDKDIARAYAQDHIQNQFVRKDKKGNISLVDMKDPKRGKELVNAERIPKQSRGENLAGILDIDKKFENGIFATLSKDSIGFLTNAFQNIKLELDINKQLESKTPRLTTAAKAGLELDYKDLFRQLIEDQTITQSTYIDATEVTNIDLPIVAVQNIRAKYKQWYEGAEDTIEGRRLSIKNFYKLIFGKPLKTDMPLNLQETALDYLEKTEGTISYLGMLAEQYKGLRLELNPWNTIDKKVAMTLLKDLSTEIMRHPIYQKANIQDFREWFMEGLNPKEFDNIIEYETFLWNKITAVVDVHNALIRAQSFKEYAIENLAMTHESVDDFIVKVMETTFEQRNRIYQTFANNLQYHKKENRRSYGDQIAFTKTVLNKELEALSNRRKGELETLPEKAYQEVEDLFDIFYIATPLLNKDFVGFRGEKRFKYLEDTNNKIKYHRKKKKEFQDEGKYYPKENELQRLYELRGGLQAEHLGELPDREQTWAIRARNKQWMSQMRYGVLELATKDRAKRIKDIRGLLDYDKILEETMDDITPPPGGQESKIQIDPSKPAVVKIKKIVPDVINIDILTDPDKLDRLIASTKPKTVGQSEKIKSDLQRIRDVIYLQAAAGNTTPLFNLASEYSSWLKQVNRTSDFIQNIDGTRLGIFARHLESKWGKDDAFTKIKRNKELIKHVEETLYEDITEKVPLQTFDDFIKGKKIKTKDVFDLAEKEYINYVEKWARDNPHLINLLADNTPGKLLKDKDIKEYGVLKDGKLVAFRNKKALEKAKKQFPYITSARTVSLAKILTDEINYLNPKEAHLRDPKGLDQILGIFQRLDRVLAPFEKRLEFDRIIRFNKKTGQMEEWGVLVPTSTLKTIAETVYRLHVNANQLNEFNVKYIGYMKNLMNEKQKNYKKHADIIWKYASALHDLGPDKLGPKREDTHFEEQQHLIKEFEKYEKEIGQITDRLNYTDEEGKRQWVSAKDYAVVVKEKVIQPIFDDALNSYIRSNHERISSMFKKQNYFKREFIPDTYVNPNHDKFWQQELSELLLNKHGAIEIRRLLWFDKALRLKQEKISGTEIQRNHFHYDDVVWIKFQLRVRDYLLDKYSNFVTKKGSLDWIKMEKTLVQEGKKTTYAMLARKDIEIWKGEYREFQQEVGKFQINKHSDRFWPQTGQTDNEFNRDFLNDEWLPSEKERIMNKTDYKLLTDAQLREDVRDGFITFEDAKLEEYQRIENRVNKTNRYVNPYVDDEAIDMMHQIPTRTDGVKYPGQGVSTHARSRLERSMPGYRRDGNVPLDYLNSVSRGLMQNISALYSRIYLDKFLRQGLNNPQMKDNVRDWHAFILDVTTSYMGHPTTRKIELHGFSKKDFELLLSWKKSGYDPSWKIGKLGIISKKLLLDMEAQAIPSFGEQRAQKRKLLADNFRKNGKRIADLKKGIKESKTSEGKKPLEEELQELYSTMFAQNRQRFQGWLEANTVANLNKLIVKKNIDKLNISHTPRSWFSDETVGNFMLNIEQNINKAYGLGTKVAFGKKKQMFKSLPDDPQLRHKAMADRARWISDVEGRFQVFSLLFHPKAAITNVYGGYQNIITDTGFEHFFNAFSEDYLLNEIFKDKEFLLYNPKTGKFEMKALLTKADIHLMIDSLGLLEGNLLQELTYLQAHEPANVQKFLGELVKKVQAHTIKNGLYGNSKEVNVEIDRYVKTTVRELGETYNINKRLMNMGSWFMSSTEKHLRRHAFLAHYLKARELYSDIEGNIEVTDEFLVESARKGVEASQFIYHATYRPNFSNTSFGKIMTRFQPYAWMSIRRRKVLFEDMMAAEGHPGFEATHRFERQVSNDMMVLALASLFHYSIFEYALSPPMSWLKESAEFLFGDEKTRKRAFYNQYPIQGLAPLQIITPPASRFILPHINGLINGDWEAFKQYTSWTYFPGGRLIRDIYKMTKKPHYAVEYMTGIPRNAMKWHYKKVKKQGEDRWKDDPSA